MDPNISDVQRLGRLTETWDCLSVRIFPVRAILFSKALSFFSKTLYSVPKPDVLYPSRKYKYISASSIRRLPSFGPKRIPQSQFHHRPLYLF